MTPGNDTFELDGMLPLAWPATSPPPRGPERRTGTQSPPIEKGISASLLTELQKEVTELEAERGTIKESIQQKSLLLTEEIFEVMKVLRVESGIATSKRPTISLGDELADVLFVCAAIANRIPTDLSVAWADQRSSHAANPPVRLGGTSATLAAALRLAKQVLEVIASVAYHKEQDKFVVDCPESISLPLMGVVSSVNLIAVNKKIDLAAALEAKLQKDQLRLWQ